jgi:hypothetical protein
MGVRGSRLVGEEALLYAERLGVDVLVSSVVRMSAARAREHVSSFAPGERQFELAQVTVDVREPALAKAS